MYKEETEKNIALTSKVNELEQLNKEVKKEMLSTKEAVESITKEMEQRKKDYSDQLAHLQDKLEKWEQQSLTQAGKYTFATVLLLSIKSYLRALVLEL